MDFRDVSQVSAISHHEDEVVYTPNHAAWPVGTTNTILNALPSKMKTELKHRLRPVILTKEHFLYQQEDRLDYIYFPETAVVSEFRILDDGRMVEIAVTGREGAVGLPSLLSGSQVASNCVQVTQSGTANRVDFLTVERLLRSDPVTSAGASHFVEAYIKQISQKAICNMFHSVRERFCTWLLMIQDRCSLKTLNLTQEQIARSLGVYRPTITCIASEMRDSRLINYTRGGISITDRRRMELAACSCYLELGRAASGY